MLDRADLKQKGMFAFKRNYWPCVAVALIIALISGGGSSGGGRSFSNSLRNKKILPVLY